MQFMKEEEITRRILNARPESKRRSGRSRTRWIDDVINDDKKMNDGMENGIGRNEGDFCRKSGMVMAGIDDDYYCYHNRNNR